MLMVTQLISGKARSQRASLCTYQVGLTVFIKIAGNYFELTPSIPASSIILS